MAQIVAQQGTKFLIIEDGLTDPNPPGHLIDLLKSTATPVEGIQQILKWGYWEEVSADDTTKNRVMALYQSPLVSALKHLAGQHDQSSHAGSGSTIGDVKALKAFAKSKKLRITYANTKYPPKQMDRFLNDPDATHFQAYDGDGYHVGDFTRKDDGFTYTDSARVQRMNETKDRFEKRAHSLGYSNFEYHPQPDGRWRVSAQGPKGSKVQKTNIYIDDRDRIIHEKGAVRYIETPSGLKKL